MNKGSSNDIHEHVGRRVPQTHAEPERQMAEIAIRIREFAIRLVRTEQRERTRLADILRDELQQLLYGVRLRLRMTHAVLGAGRDDEADQQLVQAEKLIRQCVRVTRRLRFDLSQPAFVQSDLRSILVWLRAQMRRAHGLDVELVGDDVRVEDADIRMLLFQMLRELLFSVATHSGARRARISLRDTGDKIRLEVTDDGRGIGAPTVEGESRHPPVTALTGVREAVGMLGGRLEIESNPGSGTVVQVQFPRSTMITD